MTTAAFVLDTLRDFLEAIQAMPWIWNAIAAVLVACAIVLPAALVAYYVRPD